ncbi:hypothetical protein [Kordia sp.]|uniref:hypothetical protein n=1 Tax=Kordia sp. TaxID=1965332 RepID=UPI003D2DD4DF
MNQKKATFKPNPLRDKIVKSNGVSFKLWLEFEETCNWENIENNFANVGVDTLDGRFYGINVWTYQFLQTAINYDKQNNTNINGLYQIPPDIFVEELTRDCIEKTIIDLLKKGNLEDVLNTSIFELNFIEPYWNATEIEEEHKQTLLTQLQLELPKNHVLYDKNVKLIAKKTTNKDIILKLENDSIAVVHLTWSSKQEADGFPITRMYKDKIDFWKNEMSEDIRDF